MFIVTVALTGLCLAQAPGDEASRCNETFYVHTYPDNVKILMDNWNYEQLLPGSGSGSNPIAGAVWSDVSCDSNDVTAIINPSYVSYMKALCAMYKEKSV